MVRCLVLVGALLLSGCSLFRGADYYGNVMPRSGGAFEVQSLAVTEEAATKNATTAAKLTCKARQRLAAVETVKVEYRGILLERGKEGSTAANIGTEAARRLPVPGLRRHDDYKVSMAFRCE